MRFAFTSRQLIASMQSSGIRGSGPVDHNKLRPLNEQTDDYIRHLLCQILAPAESRPARLPERLIPILYQILRT